MTKQQTNYRLTEVARVLLQNIAEARGISPASVLELIIRQEATQPGLANSGAVVAAAIEASHKDTKRQQKEIFPDRPMTAAEKKHAKASRLPELTKETR